MARYRESACRLCRRERMKLFLKGDRCYTDKCAVERRAYAPGQHVQRRTKTSEYGTQLREKQRARRMYGLLERQFRKNFFIADKQKGITGDNLLLLLERRLDNMVYKMGFSRSRDQARQLIRHNHILVNDKRVNIPSYIIKPCDAISVQEKSRKKQIIVEALESIDRRGIPEWLMLDKEKMIGKVMALPTRDQLVTPLQEHLIVEFYSK
ncbi:MAG: 30S ribosomal protein S4 [Deltaproteobacteria bacterium CG07_land_8_20_14_0_80_38_7]|nr:MAG: 30S ribosomal protein S4 [Deltaproteobacteria bacterium CG07_land_8_20_14_0_80_38_7]